MFWQDHGGESTAWNMAQEEREPTPLACISLTESYGRGWRLDRGEGENGRGEGEVVRVFSPV